MEVNPLGLLVQLYVLPLTEVAPMAADVPEQIVDGLPTLAEGAGLTVIVTLFDFEHPEEFVSRTVYTVVVDGETLGFALEEEYPEGLLDQE